MRGERRERRKEGCGKGEETLTILFVTDNGEKVERKEESRRRRR